MISTRSGTAFQGVRERFAFGEFPRNLGAEALNPGWWSKLLRTEAMLRWLVWRGSFETLREARLLPSSMGAGYSLFYARAQTSAGGTSAPSVTAEIITTIPFSGGPIDLRAHRSLGDDRHDAGYRNRDSDRPGVPVPNSKQKNRQIWSDGRLNVGSEEIEPVEREQTLLRNLAS
jgi:hypothetical protein